MNHKTHFLYFASFVDMLDPAFRIGPKLFWVAFGRDYLPVTCDMSHVLPSLYKSAFKK